MKKIFLLLMCSISLIACEGDRGPQGPPGVDGLNGYLGATVDFSANFGNNNEIYYNFADDGIVVYESDAVLVYWSEEFISDSSGDINVWKLMPQTLYFDDGSELVYNYDHTFNDVRIFLDGTIDFSTLSPEYTQNQYFRIVVVPAEFANNPNNNIQTYQGLMDAVNNQGVQLERIN